MNNMINANYTAVISSYAEKYSASKVGKRESVVTEKSTEKTELSFQNQVQKIIEKKNYVSATEDYKKRHPEYASNVDSMVRSGKEFLRRSGVENVSREDMTMEEYKRFITDLMNRIPYDWSQRQDVNVWSVTEAGWEQMKNDPDYEAWVLGYTVQDRAVNNPFAAMPGYSSNYHTEHFGASIDEHLGQSFPMNNSAAKNASGEDEESWWEKRHKRYEEMLEEHIMTAMERTKQYEKLTQQQWLETQMAGTGWIGTGWIGGF